MASFFNLSLDTLAPAGVILAINNGALYTASAAVNLAIDCSDASKTGYSMKIWGSIANAATEDAAIWEAYSASKAVNLTTGDGLKTVYVKVRDAVWNESTAVSKTITLNTAIPVVTIVGPDVSIVSKVVGKDTSIFNFNSDQDFVEFKVGIVEADNSAQGTAVVIPTAGGSLNTSGTGSHSKSENIEVTINGKDLQTAAGGADGTFIIKTFVKNAAGTWSA